MYNSYFGFAESPFENNLDQRFLFLTEDHKEVLAALLYFIMENKAFAILCGDVGTGKTMLLNSFIDRLPPSHHPIVISNPSVGFREILDYVAGTLGLETAGMNVLEVIDAVREALLAVQTEKKFYFLVIDEAHLLSDRSLDDIRLLSNIESHDRKLLQILLVGQYELSHKLQRPQMRQLRQRISINRFLSSMDFDETSRYIDHRLKKVGSSFKRCFEADCLPLIYKITDGVPRQINHLCDNALLICKAEGQKKVNRRIVRKTDKALRSDLIFAPKSLRHKEKSGWLQTRVWPLTAASFCLAVCLAVLFFGLRSYFGGVTNKTTATPRNRHTAPSHERFSDTQGDQAKRFTASETTTLQILPSSAGNGEDQGSVTFDGQPEALPEKKSLSSVIADERASLADAQGGEQDSGEGNQASPSSGAPELPISIVAPGVAPVYAARSRQTDEHDRSRISSEKVVVREGETLSAIAYRHYRKDSKETMGAIRAANPAITDENKIYVGQVLILPEVQSAYRPVRAFTEEEETDFSIQVCTLLHSSRAVAEDYAAQLKQRGYPVYINEMQAKDGSRMYKICIGKYRTEAEAMEAAVYFQGQEGNPFVIIRSEAAGDATANHGEPASGAAALEGKTSFPEQHEHMVQQRDDATQQSIPSDSAEQEIQ